MNHHIYRIIIGLALILFIGAGCSDSEKQPEQQEPTATPQQQAYAKCVQAGYTPDLVTNDEGRRFYCILPDATQCPVSEILDDSCFKKFEDAEKERKRATNQEESIDRVCNPIAEPVCGENGRTYTNTCIAKQYEVPIAHKGACTPEEIENAAPSTSTPNPTTGPTSPTSPSSPTSPRNEQTKLPDWLNIVHILAKQQTNQPIQTYQCTLNKNTYYLVKPVNCPTCFHTLYRENGTIACHTNHDIGNTCPTDSIKQGPTSACTLLTTQR